MSISLQSGGFQRCTGGGRARFALQRSRTRLIRWTRQIRGFEGPLGTRGFPPLAPRSSNRRAVQRRPSKVAARQPEDAG